MGIVKWLLIVAVVGTVVCIGCSEDTREDIADNVEGGTRQILGLSDKEKTPRVVREQQRKERIRQNNTWTAENKTQHPIEYWQAMLEKSQQAARKYETQAYEQSRAIAATKRTLRDNEVMEKNLVDYIAEVKKVFKECESLNKWPAKLRGRTFSREKMLEQYNEADAKLTEVKSIIERKKNDLATYEIKLQKTQAKQKDLVVKREKIQTKLNDVRTGRATEGDDGIDAWLAGIDDDLAASDANESDVKIEHMIQPDRKATLEETARKLMAD